MKQRVCSRRTHARRTAPLRLEVIAPHQEGAGPADVSIIALDEVGEVSASRFASGVHQRSSWELLAIYNAIGVIFPRILAAAGEHLLTVIDKTATSCYQKTWYRSVPGWRAYEAKSLTSLENSNSREAKTSANQLVIRAHYPGRVTPASFDHQMAPRPRRCRLVASAFRVFAKKEPADRPWSSGLFAFVEKQLRVRSPIAAGKIRCKICTDQDKMSMAKTRIVRDIARIH